VHPHWRESGYIQRRPHLCQSVLAEMRGNLDFIAVGVFRKDYQFLISMLDYAKRPDKPS
jgi:hypothetical protein